MPLEVDARLVAVAGRFPFGEAFGTEDGRVACVLNPPVFEGESEEIKLGVKGETRRPISSKSSSYSSEVK